MSPIHEVQIFFLISGLLMIGFTETGGLLSGNASMEDILVINNLTSPWGNSVNIL